MPGKHIAIALSINEHAAWGAPRILDARAAAGNRGAQHKRIGEAPGDYGNVLEEERVIVLIDSVIRPEHFVALAADHADDWRFLVVRGGTRVGALVFNGADISIELGVGGSPR